MNQKVRKKIKQKRERDKSETDRMSNKVKEENKKRR